MVRRFQTGKIVDFLSKEKGLLFPGKMFVCGWNLPYLEVNGICLIWKHTPYAPIIPHFNKKPS